MHGNQTYADVAASLASGMDRIPAQDRPVGYGSPAAQLARSTYKTALSNSFISAFDSRLKRGVQAWASQLPGRQPTSKRKISTIANCISGRKPVSIDRICELHPREVAFIREERALLGFERPFTGLDSTRPFGESCATDKWCKQNHFAPLAPFSARTIDGCAR
jgi:hypothetical protein